MQPASRHSICVADPGGAVYPVPAGTLDENPELHVLRHIYVKSKASWDEIADDAPCWDEDSAD
jgi:hypothetical protein